MAGHRGASSVFVPQRHSWTREHANGGEAVRDEGRISERAGRGRKTHSESVEIATGRTTTNKKHGGLVENTTATRRESVLVLSSWL